jgi:hypothetical protein
MGMSQALMIGDRAIGILAATEMATTAVRWATAHVHTRKDTSRAVFPHEKGMPQALMIDGKAIGILVATEMAITAVRRATTHVHTRRDMSRAVSRHGMEMRLQALMTDSKVGGTLVAVEMATTALRRATRHVRMKENTSRAVFRRKKMPHYLTKVGKTGGILHKTSEEAVGQMPIPNAANAFPQDHPTQCASISLLPIQVSARAAKPMNTSLMAKSPSMARWLPYWEPKLHHRMR